MKFYPENFPPIDTSQTYCVYLSSPTNIRLLYNLQNDNYYHSYMDYLVVGDNAIRQNVNLNARVERIEPMHRTCLMGTYADNDILDEVLLGRDYVYTGFWFPVIGTICFALIAFLVYRIMFRRFIK